MSDDLIDYSGKPRSLGEQRDFAFKMMKQQMLEVFKKKKAHVPPLIRGAAIAAYSEGIDDAFNVFAQIVETPTSEELSAG